MGTCSLLGNGLLSGQHLDKSPTGISSLLDSGFLISQFRRGPRDEATEQGDAVNLVLVREKRIGRCVRTLPYRADFHIIVVTHF